MAKKDKPGGMSRRAFLKGMGGGVLGSAVLTTTGIISQKAQAEILGPAAEQIRGREAITLLVNGEPRQVTIEPRTTLLEALREKLNLTGTKQVCDRGQCGACTVLLDDKPVLSCMTLALDARGKPVTTVEGLAAEGELTSLQAAFVEHDGLMCGFCTPGFVIAAHALLKRHPDPSWDEIRHGLSGNLCRCGTYPKVFEAVQAAAKSKRKGG